MNKPIKVESEVLEIKEIAPLTKHFKLSVPQDFAFIPGQFITVLINKSNEILKRLYSIASQPKDKGYIDLCLDYIENGVGSTFFFNLKKGDKINFLGPMGIFTIKNKDNNIVFIATGTGIAPFRSMINDLLENNFNKNITLLLGIKHEDEILYDNEWEALTKKHKNFEYYNIVSQPKDPTYSKNKGRVQVLVGNYIKDFNKDFYLCGVFDMIKETKELLEKRGVKKENIHFERYN